MSLPCVATDVGGVRQLITDRAEGFVVESKSAEEIRTAIETVLELPDMGKDMGEKARMQMFTKYSLDAATKQLLQIYKG